MKDYFLKPNSLSLVFYILCLVFGSQGLCQAKSTQAQKSSAEKSSAEKSSEKKSDLSKQSVVNKVKPGLDKTSEHGSAVDSSEKQGAKKIESSADERRRLRGKPLIENDAVVFGILMLILGFVFWSSSSDIWIFKKFYHVIPMLLLCYFLPSLLTFFWIVDPEESKLYKVASRYLLPASLILLTLSIDLKGIFGLGPKAVIMFLAGTVGVVLGGPIAILLISFIDPTWVGGQEPTEVWRGLTTVAGSWIGGSANQVAMKEVFQVNQAQYSAMVAVDVLVAEFWMVFLLLGVGKAKQIDNFFGADDSSIEELKNKMEKFSLGIARNPSTTDLMVIAAICFGGVGLSHFCADWIAPKLAAWAEATDAKWVTNFGLTSSFFWLVVISTTVGVLLSFTKARNYEGAGASKLGTVFIFILVAVIGMGMDITAVTRYWELFIVGLVWMLFHVGLLFVTAWFIRAPYFFLAVGSKANIGGAASAPVVAAAFHPALAPVGVLLAVLGYALGTYGAMLCGFLMKSVAPVN